jgi:ribosomal protein L5
MEDLEMVQEDTKKMFGLEIVISTSAKNKEEGLSLFRLLGFPIKKDA